MLRPTHGDRKFRANRTFAGREDERGVFDAAVRQADTRELYKVLMWYGVGGQGKSTLLREFGRMARDFNEAEKKARSGKGLALARVDFDDERLKRIDSALYSIRLQLGQASGLSFLTFDAAFVSYYRKTRPGIDVAAEFPELFRGENEAFADLLDVLGDNLSMAVDLASIALPGAGLIYKWGSRLTGRLKNWWSTRGNEVLAGIENLTPDELLQKLPSFLGIDICDGIAAKPSLRPVIVLDTYEALWRERGQKDALTDRRADGWMRLLVQDSPGALFVIAGRDRLRWDEIDEAWGAVIDAYLLGGLSDEDADRFLKAVPIVEDDVRNRIVESSEGLPFHLDLQVTQYEEMREAGQEPKPEAFGGTPSDILARFLEHLNDGDQAQLRLASYVNVITRPIMASLAQAFPGRAVNFSFDRMVARSTFTQVFDGAYTIHALMQEELQRREREDNKPLFKQIHRHLFEYHNGWLLALSDAQMADAVVRKDAPVRFEAAFTHLMTAEPNDAVSWLLKYQGWIAGQEEWPLVERLHQRALSVIAVSQRATDANFLVILNNLAAALGEQGKLDDAKPHIKQLLDSAIGLVEPNLRIVGLAHYNLGQIFRGERNLNAAESHYVEAIKILQDDSDPNTSHFLFIANAAAGESLHLQGFHERALRYFKAAVKHAYRSRSSDNLSRSVHLLAKSYQALGGYVNAISMFHLSQFPVPIDTWTGVESQVGSNDSDSSDDILPAAVLKSSLLGDYLMHHYIWDYRTLFRKGVFPEIILSSDVISGRYRSLANLEIASIDPDTSARAHIDQPPTSDEYIKAIASVVGSGDFGRTLLNVVEISSFELVIVHYDSPMFSIDKINKTIFISAPHNDLLITDANALLFVVWSRTLDLSLMDFLPSSDLPLMEFATVAHAIGLDLCVSLASFVNEQNDEYRDRYLEILSPIAREIVSLQRDERSREEIYDKYASLSDATRASAQ